MRCLAALLFCLAATLPAAAKCSPVLAAVDAIASQMTDPQGLVILYADGDQEAIKPWLASEGLAADADAYLVVRLSDGIAFVPVRRGEVCEEPGVKLDAAQSNAFIRHLRRWRARHGMPGTQGFTREWSA